MSQPTVTLERLSKTYPPTRAFTDLVRPRAPHDPVTALSDVSLDVMAGEILGLLGPNGAGKTTLVEILATLLLPTSGRAVVCGHDVVADESRVRDVIGYCPADSETMYPRLTGVENLDFFATLQGMPAAAARERIRQLLDLVGLTSKGPERVERLSDGMKSRLSLARAMLTDPEVLLLDEPTRALDPVLQVEFRRFVRDILVDRLSKTVIWVTHSLAEAEDVCHRVAILRDGRLRAVGTPDDIKAEAGVLQLSDAYARSVAL